MLAIIWLEIQMLAIIWLVIQMLAIISTYKKSQNQLTSKGFKVKTKER